MAALPNASSKRELYATHLAVPRHSICMVGNTALGAWQSHPIPLPSLHGGKQSSFLGSPSSSDIVDSESVVGIKLGDSGLVIRYYLDEFNHICIDECFIA